MYFQDVPKAVTQRMIELRRTLHRHAELAFEEEKTAATIIAELEDLGLQYEYSEIGSGIVAELHAGDNKPTIALRADMDALPVAGNTDLPFASSIEGKMHACGNDAHMAMVMGAARLLIETRPDVNVRFVFQPAEERGVLPVGAAFFAQVAEDATAEYDE
jgi:hippurate hydrolase